MIGFQQHAYFVMQAVVLPAFDLPSSPRTAYKTTNLTDHRLLAGTMPLNFDCQRFVHEWWATRQEIVLDLVGRMAVETLLAGALRLDIMFLLCFDTYKALGSWFTLWYIAMISLMCDCCC